MTLNLSVQIYSYAFQKYDSLIKLILCIISFIIFLLYVYYNYYKNVCESSQAVHYDMMIEITSSLNIMVTITLLVIVYNAGHN